MTSPDLLEDIRSGAVRLVPVEATRWQWRSRLKGGAWDAWEEGRFGQEIPPFAEVEERAVFTVSPAAPDHTPALLALIEERDRLKGERDGFRQAAGAANRALAIAQADTEAEFARALAAEAERDALRERAERAEKSAADCAQWLEVMLGELGWQEPESEQLIAASIARARALTQEQPNGNADDR